MRLVLLLASASILGGCGGLAVDSSGANGSRDASSPDAFSSDGGTHDVKTMKACAADEATTIPDDELPSVGTILMAGQEVTADAEAATASVSGTFWSIPGNASFIPSASDETTCSCRHLAIADPVDLPSAGTITVQALHCGATLATLVPKSGAPTGTRYAGATLESWSPGEAFSVTATGAPGGIAAFAGTLQTAAPFGAVMPPIGPTTKPILISRLTDLVVTWTPEGKTGESVTLTLSQLEDGTDEVCTCSTKDSAGKLTVPAATLSSAFTPTSGTMDGASATLERFIARTYAVGKSSVDLVGLVETSGGVFFD